MSLFCCFASLNGNLNGYKLYKFVNDLGLQENTSINQIILAMGAPSILNIAIWKPSWTVFPIEASVKGHLLIINPGSQNRYAKVIYEDVSSGTQWIMKMTDDDNAPASGEWEKQTTKSDLQSNMPVCSPTGIVPFDKNNVNTYRFALYNYPDGNNSGMGVTNGGDFKLRVGLSDATAHEMTYRTDGTLYLDNNKTITDTELSLLGLHVYQANVGYAIGLTNDIRLLPHGDYAFFEGSNSFINYPQALVNEGYNYGIIHVSSNHTNSGWKSFVIHANDAAASRIKVYMGYCPQPDGNLLWIDLATKSDLNGTILYEGSQVSSGTFNSFIPVDSYSHFKILWGDSLGVNYVTDAYGKGIWINLSANTNNGAIIFALVRRLLIPASGNTFQLYDGYHLEGNGAITTDNSFGINKIIGFN